MVEHRILAFSIGNPAARIAAEPARSKWDGLQVSAAGIYRVLRRNGLNTRSRRLDLVAGCAAPPGPERPGPLPDPHLEADHPGQPAPRRVQLPMSADAGKARVKTPHRGRYSACNATPGR